MRSKLDKISKDLATSEVEDRGHGAGWEMSPGREQSIEFLSSQYDQLVAFKRAAMTQIKQLTTRVNEVSIICEQVARSIIAFLDISYHCTIKIVGIPTVGEREALEQTTQLCLKLFCSLGVRIFRFLTSMLLTWCLRARLLTGQTLLCANLYGNSQTIKSWLQERILRMCKLRSWAFKNGAMSEISLCMII